MRLVLGTALVLGFLALLGCGGGDPTPVDNTGRWGQAQWDTHEFGP